MRAVRGTVPEKAQTGLTRTMRARNLFLACQCFPTQDLEVALADDVIERIEAKVSAIEFLNAEIRGVRLRPGRPGGRSDAGRGNPDCSHPVPG